MKKRKSLVIWLMANLLWLSGCSSVWNTPVGQQVTEDEKTVVLEETAQYEMTDSDRKTDADTPKRIDLDSFEPDGSMGCVREGSSLVITAPGDYLLSGSLKGESLVIRVYEDETVHLILDNVEIQSQGEPALYVEKAGKVILTAAEGTVNTFADSPHRTEESEACIFSDADLTINGSGSLTVLGYHRDGVRTRDCLKILDTNLSVKAKNDGLRGNDGVILQNSTVEIESEKTGIAAKSDKDMVVIEGGACKIIAGEYGITAKRSVTIRNCLTDFYAVMETIHCDGVCNIEGEIQ